MNIFSYLIDKVANLTGKFAASYRNHWEKANAEARAAAKSAEYANVAAVSREDYEVVGEMMAESINNTADITHLLSIANLSQLFTQPWLGRLACGVWAFRYQGRYTKGYGMTAEAVQRILQSELNRLCGVYQYPALTIHVTFGANNVVTIKVAPTNALRAAQDILL